MFTMFPLATIYTLCTPDLIHLILLSITYSPEYPTAPSGLMLSVFTIISVFSGPDNLLF